MPDAQRVVSLGWSARPKALSLSKGYIVLCLATVCPVAAATDSSRDSDAILSALSPKLSAFPLVPPQRPAATTSPAGPVEDAVTSNRKKDAERTDSAGRLKYLMPEVALV